MEFSFFATASEQGRILSLLVESLCLEILVRPEGKNRGYTRIDRLQLPLYFEANAENWRMLCLAPLSQADLILDGDYGQILPQELMQSVLHFTHGRQLSWALESSALTGPSNPLTKKAISLLKKLIATIGGFGVRFALKDGSFEVEVRRHYWTNEAVDYNLKWIQFLNPTITAENLQAWLVPDIPKPKST